MSEQKDIQNAILMSSTKWVYGFTQVDNGVINHTELDIYDKMVYIAISSMVNQADHITFPSYETIGKVAGCSRRKAIDTVKKLKAVDLIQDMGQHAKFGSNVYMIKRIQESSVLADPEKNLAFVEKEIGKQPQKPADPKPKKEPKKDDLIPYKEIIGYLNEKAGKRFVHTTEKDCRDFIRARWGSLKKVGMDDQTILGEFKWVIDVKVAHWKGTADQQYLRPSTLFRESNFDKYRNESPDVKPFTGNGQAPTQGTAKQNKNKAVLDQLRQKYSQGE